MGGGLSQGQASVHYCLFAILLHRYKLLIEEHILPDLARSLIASPHLTQPC